MSDVFRLLIETTDKDFVPRLIDFLNATCETAPLEKPGTTVTVLESGIMSHVRLVKPIDTPTPPATE